MRFNIGYVIGTLLWLPYWICVICEAQPPLTSDRALAQVTPPAIDPTSLPRRAPVFEMPSPFVQKRLVTNIEPLVVRETVSSNVVLVVPWWDNSVLRTNEQTLSTNIISRTTNTVSIP